MSIQIFHHNVPADVAFSEGDNSVSIAKGFQFQHVVATIVQYMFKTSEVAAIKTGDNDGMLIDFRNQIIRLVKETVPALVRREETVDHAVVDVQAMRFAEISFQGLTLLILPCTGANHEQATDCKYKNEWFHNVRRVMA